MSEIEILQKAYKLIGNEKVIIDAGVNRGAYTRYFLDTMKAKKIYAFEIMPDIFKLEDERIEFYNHGLSAKESYVKMIGIIPGTEGAFWFWYDGEKTKTPKEMGYGKHQHDLPIPEMKLLTKPLDSINIKEKISFIKIDVEGMEMEVLKGGKKLIAKNHPVMYIEVCRKNQSIFRRWCVENNYNNIGNFGPTVLIK